MKKFTQAMVVLCVFSLVINANLLVAPERTAALAATSLIKGGDFESNLDQNWGVWASTSTRTYELYRSYDAPFGNGSYAAAIDANGAPMDNFSAFFLGDSGRNKFAVLAGESYILNFYAKADRPLDIVFFLEDAASFSPITPVAGQSVSTSWQRYTHTLQPTTNTAAIFALALGGLPDGATLYLDGLTLYKSDLTLRTKDVSGSIGDTNKCLNFNDLSPYPLESFEIELPFYDSQAGAATLKKFRPENVTNNNICFNFYVQTFGGVGTAYVNGDPVGSFNYNVKPVIDLLVPAVPLADEDITLEGSGFSPIDENTYVVLNAMDAGGKKYNYWAKPHALDSVLTRLAVTMPVGIVQGSMYVQTTFADTNGEIKTNKSNSISYKVKPVIYSLEWSRRGFDQVGDEILIRGKAIANNPTVIFYGSNDEVIAKKTAKLVDISDEEVIKVQTPPNLNQLSVTVMANGAESDKESALVYTAKPRLNKIVTKNSRRIQGDGTTMPAAKIGEEITLNGQGFSYPDSPAAVEFQGLAGRFQVQVGPDSVLNNGTTIKISVPQNAQSGYVNVIMNGVGSNYLPLEIIPTILGVAPDPIVPGQPITVTAQGMGDNVNLTTVYFKLNNKEEVARTPTAITIDAGSVARITVNSPLAIAADSSSVTIQYNRWRSDEAAALSVPPHINEAGIEPDTNVLVIKGYGFSINPNENVITYKYADQGHTVVNPKTKMLGVFTTEEGQEIRIQILDDFHYGYVSVAVEGQTSNEYNFGPVQIRRIARRVEYVKSTGQVSGVLYISGYNFGPQGGVMVGSHWANVHYRSEFFIIAVIDPQYVYDNPVIVARQ